MKQEKRITQKEVFLPIDGYNGDYYISNFGNVLTMKRGHECNILKNQTNSYGYHHVILCRNGKRTTKVIHQLVIDAFYPIQRKGSFLLVDHIDNDRTNNCISNLRLVDYRKNVLNRIDMNNFKSKFPGVTLSKYDKKPWVARKQINGTRIYLGHFETEKLAYEAYKKA